MKFVKLIWVKATPQETIRGTKGHRVPKGTIYGGPGGWVVAGTPAKLILQYEDENGVKSDNIIDTVKEVNGWRHLTENRVYELEDRLRAIGDFSQQDMPEVFRI